MTTSSRPGPHPDGTAAAGPGIDAGLAPLAADLASQLALATELAQVGTWRHDLLTGRMHYSEQAWRVLGLEPRPEGLSIDEVRALIHPDDLPRVLAAAQRALETDGPTDMEARYRHHDGGWRYVMTRRIVQRDATGRPIAFLGVGLDLTDRIADQRRAEEMARRFELVTRTSGIGWWTFEPGSGRGEWSRTMRRVAGVGDDAPIPDIDQWFERHVHPADREPVRQRMRQWIDDGAAGALDASYRIVRDGQVRHLVSHTRMEQRQPHALIFGVVIDVTERIAAEQELRNARERAVLAARSAGIGTWEYDLDDGLTFWDEQMWRLRGHEPRPGAMTGAERLACVHPDDREGVAALTQRAFEAGATIEHEFRIVRPDGQVRWLASRSVLQRDEVTGRRRRIGVNWDITGAKNAEAAQRDREIAQRESRAKSDFLARMSHELRTPLNAVLGFSQLLLAEDNGADPATAQRRRRIDHIRSAGQHLLTLINDVLDLARLEGGELPIEVQPVALDLLVEHTLPLVQPLAGARGIVLTSRVGALHVQADPTRLRQVLLNLLSNAVKYNRDGGHARVEAAADGAGAVRLRVIDDGRGMTPAQLAQIFEPFNRLGADRESIEGTGIGLAIAKALVERMGGTIDVTSSIGDGTVFEVRLPEAPARALAAPMPAPAPAPPAPSAAAPALAAADGRARHRLLYIEDNPVNALIIRELVARRPDLELTVAPDGTSGVAQATAGRPDLILLDMQLPDFDGFEVMRRLRQREATAAIPVIALSANAMPDDIQRALAAGLADYWTKPLDFAAFMSHLDRLFGKAPA